MSEEIPHIQYRSGQGNAIEGIEIITLKNLKKRKDNFDHHPEKAHQLHFYKLFFYTK
ncbi:MAG: hypothetical protein AB3N14_00770 [Flavobacteriaceae bacterium]